MVRSRPILPCASTIAVVHGATPSFRVRLTRGCRPSGVTGSWLVAMSRKQNHRIARLPVAATWRYPPACAVDHCVPSPARPSLSWLMRARESLRPRWNTLRSVRISVVKPMPVFHRSPVRAILVATPSEPQSRGISRPSLSVMKLLVGGPLFRPTSIIQKASR